MTTYAEITGDVLLRLFATDSQTRQRGVPKLGLREKKTANAESCAKPRSLAGAPLSALGPLPESRRDTVLQLLEIMVGTEYDSPLFLCTPPVLSVYLAWYVRSVVLYRR